MVHIHRGVPAALAAWAAAFAGAAAAAPTAREAPKDAPRKLYVAVFDLAGPGAKEAEALADTIRIRLRRHEEFEVIDRLTMREAAPAALPVETDPQKVSALMNDRLGVNLAIYGTATPLGAGLSARLRCIDLTDPKNPGGWVKELSDPTERARAEISRQVVELLRRESEWKPPEYGDEEEPKPGEWGPPVNVNGRFEEGPKGWQPPDNAATFLRPGPSGRGTVLQITTDLQRAPYMEYIRRLRFGQASPANPPKIGKDSSYASLAGMEGVFHEGDWIDAAPGRRYWLIADMKGKTAGIFFPKIFVKGYLDYTDHATELPEQSLVERKLSAGQFADLAAEKRKELLADDVRKHPERYRRECFRWYLSCRNEEDVWKHYGAPFPPRGGLPAGVRWLKVQIYAYWPPGDFLFDDVILYTDPRQKAPLPEEKPRTENFPGGGIRPR